MTRIAARVATTSCTFLGRRPATHPTHYYRSIENLYQGEVDHKRGTVWKPWRKLNVQIAGRAVSPTVFLGRLHLFWSEITTRPTIEIQGGDSNFTGYQHKLSVRYTTLRADGSWTAPQALDLTDAFLP